MAMRSEAMLTAAREQKGIGPMRDTKDGWTLEPELRTQMTKLFRSQATLCRHLRTNPRTWRDIQDGVGVREGTLRGVVIEFVSFLVKAADGKLAASASDFHEQVAAVLHKQYASYMDNLEFEKLMVPPHSL